MVAQVEREPTFSGRRTREPLFSLVNGDATLGGLVQGRRFDIAPDGRLIFPTSWKGDDTDFNGLIFVEDGFEELTERVPVD